jgi:hypothetical protein
MYLESSIDLPLLYGYGREEHASEGKDSES